MTDEEERPIFLPNQPRPKKAAGPRETPPDKPLDGPTTKTEVQRALVVVYNLVHKLLHDEERFTASDFSEEADGLVELMQQHAMLRVAMRIVAPLAAIGAIIEKVEGTITRFRQRKAIEKRHKEMAEPPPAPVGIVNGKAEDLSARPFGR